MGYIIVEQVYQVKWLFAQCFAGYRLRKAVFAVAAQ